MKDDLVFDVGLHTGDDTDYKIILHSRRLSLLFAQILPIEHVTFKGSILDAHPATQEAKKSMPNGTAITTWPLLSGMLVVYKRPFADNFPNRGSFWQSNRFQP